MPSGWDVYYVVFLSAFLALGIPATLGLVSFLFSGRKKKAPPRVVAATDRNQAILGKRMNARFFLGANATLVLITLILALIPLTGMIQAGKEKSTILRGLLLIVSIATIAALGLLYSARKGDLGWLDIYQRPKDKEPK